MRLWVYRQGRPCGRLGCPPSGIVELSHNDCARFLARRREENVPGPPRPNRYAARATAQGSMWRRAGQFSQTPGICGYIPIGPAKIDTSQIVTAVVHLLHKLGGP